MKYCKYCKKKYPANSFPVALTTNTKVFRRLKCNNCYLETKRNNRNKKRKWLEEYKKTLNCSNCGNNNFKVLEFHHVGTNKEIEIANSIAKHSIDKVKTEIAKCIVLCANCHREHHYDKKTGI